MLQQIMAPPGTIEFKEVPVLEVKPGHVLIKIMKIGICGSDIHVFHGEHSFTSYPVTQGHEVSGEIAEIGKGVTGFKKEQKVTVQSQVVCRRCYPCRHGKYNLCEELKVMGFQTTSMASNYFTVNSSKVTLLPEEMTFYEGVMIEPLAVAAHVIKRAGDVKGLKIAVLCAGTIGILLAQTAKGMGAESVLITDISDIRLAKAKECGVDSIINTKNMDFGEAIITNFGPDKADIIYNCAGNDITIGQALKHAHKGSTIILVAIFAGMTKIDLAVLNDHKLDLNTNMMYRNEDYVDVIELVKDGKVQLKPLISKYFPFQSYLETYQYIDKNRETTMKVIINVQE